MMIATSRAHAAPDDAVVVEHERTQPRPNTIELSVVGGIGAGVLFIPPVPFAAPFAGVKGRYRRTFLSRGSVGVEGELAIGNNETGKPIGGYNGLAFIGGTWLDAGWLVGESQFRGGVTSYLLVPLVQVGFAHQLVLRPVRTDHFVWQLGSDLNTDLAGWLPVISGGGWTEFRVQSRGPFVALRLGGGYSIGVFNGAGVAASARLTTGYAF